jgi:hypothetical protein
MKKRFEFGGFEIEHVAYILDGTNYYENMCSLYAQNLWLNYALIEGRNHGSL